MFTVLYIVYWDYLLGQDQNCWVMKDYGSAISNFPKKWPRKILGINVHVDAFQFHVMFVNQQLNNKLEALHSKIAQQLTFFLSNSFQDSKRRLKISALSNNVGKVLIYA